MPFSLGENGFSTLSSVYTITGTALAPKLRDLLLHLPMLGREQKQISPLRCAPVEMTES